MRDVASSEVHIGHFGSSFRGKGSGERNKDKVISTTETNFLSSGQGNGKNV